MCTFIHRRIASAVVLALAVTFPLAKAGAEDTGELARLREQVAAQQKLIQELRKRLETVESSQQTILEQLKAATAGSEQTAGLAEEVEGTRDDVQMVEERLDSLPTLGGYFDSEYFNDTRSNSPGRFRQHHVALLLSKEHKQFRFFTEAELEFGAHFSGTGGANVVDSRGELELDQAWAEYVHSDAVTLRTGLILTPGHWNVRHWPNLTLTTRPPRMVNQVFPKNFAGGMVYGTTLLGSGGLTYHAYLGNGESPDFGRTDNNEGKAVGGRLSFHLPKPESFDTLDLGVSGYVEDPPGPGRTRIWGLDAQLRQGLYEVLCEFGERHANMKRIGLYVQPSYQLSDRLTAFYRYDRLDAFGGDKIREHTVGLRYDPIADLSLKLEHFRSAHSIGEDFNGVATSVAVVY